MIRLAAIFAWGLLAAVQAAELDLRAPNPNASPVNQLRISGNACGPAALLCAFQFGSRDWQTLAAALPGNDDRGRMSYIIRAHGLKPSAHLPNRTRWDRKNGVNLLDLTEIGNELRGGNWRIPKLKSEVLVSKRRETELKLLRRAHERFSKSLKRGLPPLVSLRRMARPANRNGAGAWRVAYGHFVVITGLPAKLERGATSFPIRYIDPWGGKILEGTIRFAPETGFPSLLASVPSSSVGKNNVKPGETSLVSLSAVIGAF